MFLTALLVALLARSTLHGSSVTCPIPAEGFWGAELGPLDEFGLPVGIGMDIGAAEAADLALFLALGAAPE